MIKQTLVVVKAEEQGADDLFFGGITKAADDTISCACELDLLHPISFATAILALELFCDNAVKIDAYTLKPFSRHGDCGRGW